MRILLRVLFLAYFAPQGKGAKNGALLTMLSLFLAFFLFVFVFGWVLLLKTSASLLLPNFDAVSDRCKYVLSKDTTGLQNVLRLKLFVLIHLLYTFIVLLPCASFLWILDEVLFARYINVIIEKPVITISVPRAGTTSFHRTLALDEQFATPTMLDLVLPFVCLQKVIYAIRYSFPELTRKLETFLKWINRVTPEVEARHPISLFAPDADDILLGEWHWSSVGAVRTFPVFLYWKRHYQMTSNAQRQRSLELHKRMCQKVLYSRGSPKAGSFQRKRLLLRSHLSPFLREFEDLYPDATFVGIMRDPLDILRSFAGLSNAAVYASTGVDIFKRANADGSNQNTPWSAVIVQILADMMRREAYLYDTGGGIRNKNSHHVKFRDFKQDSLACLESLYKKASLSMTTQMKEAIGRGLEHHETYKTRHSYRNPTLQDLGIDKDAFLQLSGVRHYCTVLHQHN
jgi:hypothetical protein